MKCARSIIVCAGVIVAALFASTALFAQEWSAAQQEVWKTVEKYDSLWAQGDAEGYLSYFHPDLTWWATGDDAPRGKEELAKWLRFECKTHETLVHEVTPATIRVFGNVSVVCYYWQHQVKNKANGTETLWKGRGTFTFLKEKNRLTVIAVDSGPYSMTKVEW